MASIKKGISIILPVLFLVLLLSAISSNPLYAAGPSPRYGGTLRLSDLSDGVSMGYPPKLVRIYANRMAAPAVETLFRFDKSGKPVPYLVSSFKVDAKKMMLTLTLKKGIKFHDGTDFDAEAVKWNLDQCRSAKTAGTEKFKSIDVINHDTVRINLTEWDNTVISNLALTVGMIISPTAYKTNGEEWCAKNPIGTGPFQFVSWDKDTRTVYKKFPGYWQKGIPYLDGIIWMPILDNFTRTSALRAGETDLILFTTGKDVADLEKSGFVVKRQKVGSGTISITFDSANPTSPFAQLKVRQAAQHAIDGTGLNKAIYFGEVEPANQWTYKGHWAYDQTIKGYPYDPARAKKLLAEAGYPNGFKTKLTHLTSPDNDKLYQAVQGYLQAVGIDAQLEPVQSGRYDTIYVQGAAWDGIVEVSPASANPDLTSVMAMRYRKGTKNYTQTLLPDDFVKAIQDSINARDFNSKRKSIQEALRLMSDKYCLNAFLVGRGQFAIGRATVHDHGFMTTPAAGQWTPELAWLEQ
jgi:peptide/nickel transport system substrate-binding protein